MGHRLKWPTKLGWFCNDVQCLAPSPGEAPLTFIQRMQHIRGHILCDARLSAKNMRPDFGVITHLHDAGLLSDAEFEAARMGEPSQQQDRQQHIPVSPIISYNPNHRQLTGFYGDLPTAGANGLPMPAYHPYMVPPFQVPTAGPEKGGPVGIALPPQHKVSTGAWSQDDDRTLLVLRAMGKNWNQIQEAAFPSKTVNTCRKRHERLIEHGQTEFDNRKLDRLCAEYMTMRKETWQPLASRYGEKWDVVEMQVRHPPSPSSTSLH
jgi:hypothetical protein